MYVPIFEPSTERRTAEVLATVLRLGAMEEHAADCVCVCVCVCVKGGFRA